MVTLERICQVCRVKQRTVRLVLLCVLSVGVQYVQGQQSLEVGTCIRYGGHEAGGRY